MKIYFYLFFVWACGTSLVAQIPTNGLLRHYPFNGNATDLGAGAQNGSVVGAVLTTDRFGVPDAAYHFNKLIGGYIDLPVNGLLLNNYTYSVWANLSSYPELGFRSWVLSIGSSGGDQSINYNNFYSAGGNSWAAHCYETQLPHAFIYSEQTAVTGAWYHIVVSRDNEKTRLYVNGQKIDSFTHATNSAAFYGNGTVKARLGGRFDNTLSFDGKIDDLRIYNRALTDDEITGLHIAESICIDRIAVTDTLIINANISGVSTTLPDYTIKIYPNPTSDYIIIDYGNNNSLDGYQIRITNTANQAVFTHTINQTQSLINLSSWTGLGVYFVYLTDPQGNTVDVRKIVLQ